MKRFAFALAFALISLHPTHAAETPKADHVVLGWEEFIKLWTQAQTPKPEPDRPPVDAAITRAEYAGTVHPRSTEIIATFEISVLAENKWVRLPFLPASAGMREARLDGAAVPVITDGGVHAVLMKGAGRHTLRASFSIATGARDGDPQFSFQTTETPITLVSLTFAQPNLDVQIEPAQALASKSEGGQTVVQAILPRTGHVRVSWRRKQPPERELPAKVYARIHQLVSIDEAALKIGVQVGYTILHSGIESVALRVPESVSVLGVTGSGVQSWKVDKSVLTVAFDRRAKGERAIHVQAERPLAGDATLPAPIFAAISVVRQEVAVAVEATGNVEVSVTETKGLRQVDVKELPAGLWSLARNPLLYGFTAIDAGGVFTMAVTRHEDVPVLASTVDSANAVTVLTKDGQAVTRVAFYVRNHLKQFLALTLPEGAEIWSAFVNNRAVKPSRNAAGDILIPLDKSQLGFNDAAFPVEIVYYARASRLGIAGRARPALPKIDLPVSQLLWSVYAPEEIRLVHAGGNVDQDRVVGVLPMPASVAADEMRVLAKKDKSSYLRRAESELAAMGNGVAVPQAAARQAAMELDAADGKALENHVLPIAFHIPEMGRLYRFGKIMVTRESPVVNMTYVRHGAIGAAKGLFTLVVMVVAYRRRRAFLALAPYATAAGQKLAAYLRAAKPEGAAH